MINTFKYDTSVALNQSEKDKVKETLEKMRARAENQRNSIEKITNIKISNNTVELTAEYNTTCNMRASILGSLNEVLGKGRLN